MTEWDQYGFVKTPEQLQARLDEVYARGDNAYALSSLAENAATHLSLLGRYYHTVWHYEQRKHFWEQATGKPEVKVRTVPRAFRQVPATNPVFWYEFTPDGHLHVVRRDSAFGMIVYNKGHGNFTAIDDPFAGLHHITNAAEILAGTAPLLPDVPYPEPEPFRPIPSSSDVAEIVRIIEATTKKEKP